jgi:hypothetical protein
MANHVIDRLFENQQQVAPLFRIELDAFTFRRHLEIKLDAFGF